MGTTTCFSCLFLLSLDKHADRMIIPSGEPFLARDEAMQLAERVEDISGICVCY